MLSTFAIVLFGIVLFGAGTAFGASEPPESTVEPTLTAIEATAATAVPLSPLSNVKGIAFDRFFQVWLENTVRIHIPWGCISRPVMLVAEIQAGL